MKASKIFVAAACAFFCSTAAFAQTTPSGTSGTMTTSPQSGNMQNGTMQNGTMQNGTSNGTMQNGTMQRGTGTNNGSMNGTGTMDRKTKMNSRKDTKKTKMSTSPSSTGTM